MQKTEAAMILAGVTPEEQRQASAPTNLHVITGTIAGKSENGKTKVLLEGLVFTADDNQYIEVDTLGGLEEGDVATILLTGEPGRAMTPLAVGAPGSIDRIDVRIKSIEADYIKATVLDAEVARLGYLTADNAVIQELETGKAYIDDLTANNITVARIVANSAYIKELELDGITADEITAATGYIDDLTANNITTDKIQATTGYIDDLTAANITASDISADHATVGQLDATYATIGSLSAEQARVDNLLAGKASVADLTAANGRIDNLQSTKADISVLESDYITANTIDATYLHADMSNADVAWIQNGVIKDGSISNAMINDVSANKLTAGTINGSVINVTNLNADNITAGTINGQRIGQGSLSLDKLSENVYTEQEVDNKLATMQAEIDGAIETWTGTAVPTLNNSPASNWTTAAIRDTHVGDVYFVVNSQSEQNGYNYRFTKSGSTYSWQLIKDSDVTNALQRLSTAEGKITTFDSDISTLKTDTGTLKTKTTDLETRMSDAEDDILDKVSTTTFNEVSDTVDQHSQTITQMSQTLSNKADGSTVTALTTRVSKTEQDITGINTTIGELSTTVESKADGSTVESVNNRLNTVSDTVDGHTQTLTSVQNTLSSKADSSTVSTLATKVSTAETSIVQTNEKISQKANASDVYTKTQVDGKITQEVNDRNSAIEQSASAIYFSVSQNYTTKTEFDNLEIGGRNLLYKRVADGRRTTANGDYSIILNASENLDTYFTLYTRTQLVEGTTYVISCEASGINGEGVFYKFPLFRQGSTIRSLTIDRNGINSFSFVMNATELGYHVARTVDDLTVYAVMMDDVERNIEGQTGPITLTNFKIEKGNKSTDWTPAPEDAGAYTDAQISAAKSEIKATTDGISSTVSKISSVKYVTSSTASWPLSSIKTYAAEGSSGGWNVTSTDGLRVGDTVYVKGTDSTRQCSVYIKITITSIDSTTHFNGVSHGYEDVLPVDTIKSTINQSSDSVKIQAKHVEIDGAAIFSAISSDVDNAITDKGYQTASQVNTAITSKGYATTTQAQGYATTAVDGIQIGGRNLLLGTGTLFPKTGTSSSYFIDFNVSNNGLQNSYELIAGTEYTFSVDVTSSVEPFLISVGAGSGAFSRDVASKHDCTSGRISITFTPQQSQLSNGAVFAFRAPRYATQGTSFTYTVDKPKLEVGNKPTDWSIAPEDAVKRTQRIWYRKSAAGAPATPGTASSNWVVKADDGSNAWTKMHVAISSTEKFIYTCEQYEMGNGTIGYTSVLLDNTITVIDGGNIITDSVTANQIAAGTITGNEIAGGTITSDNIAAGAISADRLDANALTVGNIAGLEDQLETITNGISSLSNSTQWVHFQDSVGTVFGEAGSANNVTVKADGVYFNTEGGEAARASAGIFYSNEMQANDSISTPILKMGNWALAQSGTTFSIEYLG